MLSFQSKIYDIFKNPNTPINSSSIETAKNLVTSSSKLAYYTSTDSTFNGFVGLLPEVYVNTTVYESLRNVSARPKRFSVAIATANQNADLTIISFAGIRTQKWSDQQGENIGFY